MVGLVHDRGQLLLLLGRKIRRHQQDVGVNGNNTEHVVEIVGEPCCQLPNRCQPVLCFLVALLFPLPRHLVEHQHPRRVGHLWLHLAGIQDEVAASVHQLLPALFRRKDLG